MKILRTAGAVFAVFALAGCGSSQPSVEIAQPEQTETSQADNGEQSGAGQGESDPDEPIRPTGGAATPKRQDRKLAPKKSSSSGGGGGNPLNKYFADLPANPGPHQGIDVDWVDGPVYYFQAPSKVHFCMITEKYVGCQSQNPPKDGPKVEYPDGEVARANAVYMAKGSPAKMTGISDTAYIDQGGAPAVLDYDMVLDVNGFQCTTNKSDGVICKQGSHGFQFSSKNHKIL